MGIANYSKTSFLIMILAIVSIGITAGSVLAAQTIPEDLVIEAGGGEPGDLTVQDGQVFIPNGNLIIGVGGTPTNALIDATGTGLTVFRVTAVSGSGIFNLQSQGPGAQVGLQFTDLDGIGPGSGTKMRLASPGNDNRLDFTNENAAFMDKFLMTIRDNGNVGIGTTSPTSKLHVVGDFTLQSNIICTDCIDSTDILDGTITSADLAPGVAGVPIGTVLDWWCSVDCTIPDGFVIADGQLISDAASPFDGENVPNLTDTFIRGVTNVGNVGNTAGVSTHSHAIGSHVHTTSSAGSHTHDVDPSVMDTSFEFDVHRHVWSILTSQETWTTFGADGESFNQMIDWTNGIHNDGSGIFPIAKSCTNNNCPGEAFYTENSNTGHSHSFDVPNTPTTSGGNHNHGNTGSSGSGNTSSEGNEPPWFGLVKIIRIK